MKRKRLLWIVALFAAITATVWISAPNQGQIGRTAYSRIQLGISKEDVLSIMVLPPGNYATDFYTSVSKESEGRLGTGRGLSWISNHAMIDVEFDEREEVCGKDLHIIETQGSVHQRLRRLWVSIKSWF